VGCPFRALEKILFQNQKSTIVIHQSSIKPKDEVAVLEEWISE
jgi:hypothetical protein